MLPPLVSAMQGSFGSVYLAVWRGITVAVKMMHLPSSFLDKQDARQDFGDCSELPQQNAVAGSSGRRAPGGEQEQQGDSSTGAGCLQHFAILEAVLSSILSHPNIVQVYTYMLTPLFDETTIGSINSSSASNDGNRHGPERHTIVCEQGSTAADVATAARAAAGGAAVAGWSLKLVMEYCSEVSGVFVCQWHKARQGYVYVYVEQGLPAVHHCWGGVLKATQDLPWLQEA